MKKTLLLFAACLAILSCTGLGNQGEPKIAVFAVHINTIAEKYHGGGHACASGATVYSREEMEALLRDADAHIKAYKETNEGWL